MKQVYRFVGSKGFILPLVSWPFFWITWLFLDAGGFQAGRQAKEPEAPAEKVSAVEKETDDGDGFDFSQFIVSDEAFNTATGGGEGKEDVEIELPSEAALNLHETLTDETGKYAILYFVWVTALTPLKVLFRRSKFVSALNRHRRTIGLASFFYACLHFGVYLTNGLTTVANDLTAWIPYILAGWAGFLILMVLAVTSNNWSLRKLGGKKWKLLHRLAYLLVPVLFYHQAFTGKGGPERPETIREALLWFSPLILLQPLRIYVEWKRRTEKQGKAGSV